MRSTLGGFFIESGQEGLDESHGSNRSRLPPGVRTMNVECPSQVIESLCDTTLRIYRNAFASVTARITDVGGSQRAMSVTYEILYRSKPMRACGVRRTGLRMLTPIGVAGQ